MFIDRRSWIGAAIATALMLHPSFALAPAAPRIETRYASAQGEGKKKRASRRHYQVEMEHGEPNRRAKRRNAYYRRPAIGNRKVLA